MVLIEEVIEPEIRKPVKVEEKKQSPVKKVDQPAPQG